ncbi:MAG TPA: hypothetical protein VFO62_03035 [Candidatus Binatia bacterium]|nr:hypothetical protein [Candidatus Binatia bacterium]
MNTKRLVLVAAMSLALGWLFAAPSVATEPVTIAGPTQSTYKLAITGMT